MDYDDARRVGDAAEMRVATALSKLQPVYGLSVLHDVLIGKKTGAGSSITAQLDHVVVDQFGVVVIETKARTGALLRGTAVDSKWTACYPGKNHSFHNPLRQNEQHVSLLYQLLKEQYPSLALDRVRSLVVFVDTDVSQLDLDAVNALRVTVVDGLGEWFEGRNDFPPMPPMDPQEQSAVACSLLELDRSNDPGFMQAHAQYRSERSTMPGQRSASGDKQTPRTAPATGRAASSSKTPRPSVTRSPSMVGSTGSSGGIPKLETRTLIGVALGVAAVLFALWAIAGLLSGTAPTWVYVAALLLLAAFGGEEKGRRRRRPARRASVAPAVPAGRRFVAGLVGAVLMVGIGFGFIWYAQKAVQPMAQSGVIGSLAVPSAEPAADIAAAKGALRDADPDIFGALVAPDSPAVSSSAEGVSYEWEYLQKSGKDSVNVKQISITLDAAGNIIRTRMP